MWPTCAGRPAYLASTPYAAGDAVPSSPAPQGAERRVYFFQRMYTLQPIREQQADLGHRVLQRAGGEPRGRALAAAAAAPPPPPPPPCAGARTYRHLPPPAAGLNVSNQPPLLPHTAHSPHPSTTPTLPTSPPPPTHPPPTGAWCADSRPGLCVRQGGVGGPQFSDQKGGAGRGRHLVQPLLRLARVRRQGVLPGGGPQHVRRAACRSRAVAPPAAARRVPPLLSTAASHRMIPTVIDDRSHTRTHCPTASPLLLCCWPCTPRPPCRIYDTRPGTCLRQYARPAALPLPPRSATSLMPLPPRSYAWQHQTLLFDCSFSRPPTQRPAAARPPPTPARAVTSSQHCASRFAGVTRRVGVCVGSCER